jgi:glycogen debranching enzyme
MSEKWEVMDAARDVAENAQSPFYITAFGPPHRSRCTLKHNDCFAVLDNHGDIGCSGLGDGLFAYDTRYLSKLTLLFNGMEPLLLGSTLRDDNLNLSTDLTNPDVFSDDELVLLKDTVHISRTTYLHDGALRERTALTNQGTEPVTATLSIVFDSDFADLFEVRGMRRPARGRIEKKVFGDNRVVLRYTGLDGKVRETALIFDPAPTELTTRSARYDLTLFPRVVRQQIVTVSCNGECGEKTIPSFFHGLARARRDLVGDPKTAVAINISNTGLNDIVCQSLADLRILMTTTPDGRYPYAGIPWYSTTFGRDGLITALQLLWCDPSIARGVLQRLARFQAAADDPAADAQPGKILHEMRSGEMAALGEVPFGLYYGSVDSTPLMVLLAGLYFERTGDQAFLREIWPNVLRALEWIDGPGDPDGDGFVEYSRASLKGLANQGWKDSHDAIFHANGDLAEGPIALIEVQGYVYAARLAAAACAERLGETARAAELRAKAARLRESFEEAFWCEDLGTYAVALDGAKRPCRVRTSNAAHAMFSGIMSPGRAHSVAADIARPSFNSGWGIRTVASTEARYNPMSYHNGSIWPHDNAMIAAGLAKYGLIEGITPIFSGIMQAAAYMDQRRLPELFCGFRRRRSRGPTLYPVACSPQAWASGAVFQLLQAILGLEYDLRAKAIKLRNPAVPMSVGEIAVRNFRLGDAAISFCVRPQPNGTISLSVLESTGNIEISVVLDSPQAAG